MLSRTSALALTTIFLTACSVCSATTATLTIESTDGSRATTRISLPAQLMITRLHLVSYGFQRDMDAEWHKVRRSGTSLSNTQTATIFVDGATLTVVTIDGSQQEVRHNISGGKIKTNLRTKKLAVDATVNGKEFETTIDLSRKYVYIDVPHPKTVALIKHNDHWAFGVSRVYPGSKIHYEFGQVAKKHDVFGLLFSFVVNQGGGLDTMFEGLDAPTEKGEAIKSSLKSLGYKVTEVDK